MIRIVRVYDPVYETTTVPDYEYYQIVKGVPVLITKEEYDALGPLVAKTAVLIGEHEETTMTKAGRVVVYSKRMRPIRQFTPESAIGDITWDMAVSKGELGNGWTWSYWEDAPPNAEGEDRLGKYTQAAFKLKNPNKKPFTIEDRAGFLEGF